MKGAGDYVDEKDHHRHSNMFAKQQLHPPLQTHKFHPHPHPHHHQQPPTTFHHFQTSDETDSRSTGPTATTTTAGGDGASIEVARRPRGRPPGSKNKPKPPVIITRDNEPSMSPYVLELPGGIDIVDAVTRFCRKRNTGLCVLTGSGTVANVSLKQPSTTPGATVTFHGRFDILSLSATVLPTGSGSDLPSVANGFTISLAGPQGQIVGGSVVGPLLAAGTIYIIAASFNNPSYHRLPGGGREDEARNSVSGGTEQQGRSPPGGSVSGGGDSGHPPAAESCGMPMYSCQLPSDVIWAPTARQPPPPPY